MSGHINLYSAIGCPDRILTKAYSMKAYSINLLSVVFLYEVFKVQLIQAFRLNGDGEIRTLDPLLARQVLSQLSYAPTDISCIKLHIYFNGLKWTRTTDLTLIRRAL